MDRNRYIFRRQGSQQSHQNQHQQQHSSSSSSTSPSSVSHDELIRFIHEAWNKVNEQGTPVINCSETDHQLKNFKPFNLEEFWGQRLVQNIHISHDKILSKE